MERYRTKDVLEIVGVTRKTLKSWLRKGVAEPRRAANGYREFDDDDLRRIMNYKQELLARTNYQIGAQK